MLCMRPLDALDLQPGLQPDMDDWTPLQRSSSLSCFRVTTEDTSKCAEPTYSHCEKDDFSVRRCTTLSYYYTLPDLEISTGKTSESLDSTDKMSNYFGQLSDISPDSKDAFKFTIPSPVRVNDFPPHSPENLAESPIAEWSDTNLPETPKQEPIDYTIARRTNTLQTPKPKTLADRLAGDQLASTSLQAAIRFTSRLETFRSEKQSSFFLRNSSV